MRLLKNVRLLRNGNTHHRENLARRCILDDHSLLRILLLAIKPKLKSYKWPSDFLDARTT